jgi:lipopolysaccharide export system protein LptA
MEFMPASIERMRLWIVIAGGLLILGILLFFAYARWQMRRVARDLPAKLGISIQQSTNGFTLSKSQGGHTLFTLHAAKVLQYRGGGRAELHDVSITLYGPDGSPADYIFGNDFEYDPAGVIQAKGEVRIDLQGLVGQGPAGANRASDEEENKHIVHVKTSDLVFDQKLGTADTNQQIEFRIADAAGSATGANFDTRAGTVILESDVALDSSVNGTPLSIRATHAQYDRAGQVLHLTRSRTEYRYGTGVSNEATVYFRDDGSAERVEAQGHVSIESGKRTITAQQASAYLDERSEPVRVTLERNVRYQSQDPLQQMQGSSDRGTLSFGPQASLRHARLAGAVSMDDRLIPPGSKSEKASDLKTIDRTLHAAQVDIDFSSAPDRRAQAQQVVATGNAAMDIHNTYVKSPPQDTSVRADRLLAILHGGSALTSLRGVGNARLMQLNSRGVTQTSSSDTLLMKFAPPSAKEKHARAGVEEGTGLQSSELQGNVVLVQKNGDKQDAKLGFTARAQRADYDAASQMVHLTGNPTVYDSNEDLAATEIEVNRSTGNAIAVGAVQVTLSNKPGTGKGSGPQGFGLGGSEPVHLVAARANLDRAKNLSLFYGSGAEKAKIWQGADYITAPILEISRLRQTLYAHGGTGAAVDAAFVSSADNTTRKVVPAEMKDRNPVVRISSNTLLYSDAEQKAVFRGGVVAEDASGSMRSDAMDVFFSSGRGAKLSVASQGRVTAPPMQRSGRQLERMVAQGHVRIELPGRLATGQELTYTIQQGRFVLVGNESEPPRLVDEVHGTVTGASLIFNDRDDSVFVSGGSSRAVTETRTAK